MRATISFTIRRTWRLGFSRWIACRHVIRGGAAAHVHHEGRLALCEACEKLVHERFGGSYDAFAGADLEGELGERVLHGMHVEHVAGLERVEG